MNDELTPREHSEMKDLVLAGSQRIRPAGRHRAQFIAGALALVLVAGVAGGAIATAALLGSEAQPAPAMTTIELAPVPSPEKTVEPEPTPPSEGVVAFGGECENVLSLAEISEALGVQVEEYGPQWSTGAVEKLGGITCRWRDALPSPFPSMSLSAFPVEAVPTSELTEHDAQCAWVEGWSEYSAPCTIRRIVDGVWLSMSVLPGMDDPVALDDLAQLASERVEGFAAPRRATPGDAWWSRANCADIDAAVDIAGAAGLTSQALQTERESADVEYTSGAIEECRWSLDHGVQEFRVRIIPGGAAAFDTIASSENAEEVLVDGAVRASTAMDDDAWEKYFPVLAVTDEVNLLILQPIGDPLTPTLSVDDQRALAAQMLVVLDR